MNRLTVPEQALKTWYESVSRMVEDAVFAIATEGPHRDAIISDTFMRNARALRTADIDRDGALYTPMVFLLVSASRMLGTPIQPSHWAAALKNVQELLSTNSAYYDKGLDLDSPAGMFKALLEEALINTGLSGEPTVADEHSRKLALGLVINWGLRFLIAYAIECVGLPRDLDHVQDLGWLRAKLAAGGLQMTAGEQAVPIVRRLFERRDFDGVQLEATSIRDASTANRAQVKTKLEEVVVQRVRLDLIQPKLGYSLELVRGWEAAFPDLVSAGGGTRYETWEELVRGALFFQPGALHRAVEAIEDTIERYCAMLPAAPANRTP